MGLFRGAYAEYYGEASMLFVYVRVKMRLELLYFNATHIKWLTYVKVETPLKTFENSTTSWVSLRGRREGMIEDTVYIEGIGTHDVYIMHSRGATYYLDKQSGWPLKIDIAIYQQYSLSLRLIRSNIPILKEMLKSGE